jgi:hypothetical protein
MENVVIIYGHLEYLTELWYIFGPMVQFMALRYMLWSFGILYGPLVCILCGPLVYFMALWYTLLPFCIHI